VIIPAYKFHLILLTDKLTVQIYANFIKIQQLRKHLVSGNSSRRMKHKIQMQVLFAMEGNDGLVA